MNNVTYKRHEHAGVGYDLPAHLKINGKMPNVFAESKTPAAGIAIECDVNEAVWDATLTLQDQPLPVSPSLATRLVRRRTIEVPYPGRELVVESIVQQTGRMDWDWLVTFVAHGRKFLVKIFGVGSFADAEPTWCHVIESFRVKPD